MQKALLFTLLLSALKMFSQEVPKDSIIYLQEVVISKNKSKAKIVKIKTEGRTVDGLGMQKLPGQISLIKNIPTGYLSYVTFNFNSGFINLHKKSSGVVYKNTELSLVIYTVNKDGAPGDRLNDTEIRFIVGEKHRGDLKLDLQPLHLQSRDQLFIGIESLSSEEGNSMVLELQQSKTAVSYTKDKEGNWYVWSFYDIGLQIKMQVGVAVE